MKRIIRFFVFVVLITTYFSIQARYYNPDTGRFITADTVTPGGGADPQGLNRYSYCLNNPMKYLDPTGHEPEKNKVINSNNLFNSSLSMNVKYIYNWKNHKIDTENINLMNFYETANQQILPNQFQWNYPSKKVNSNADSTVNVTNISKKTEDANSSKQHPYDAGVSEINIVCDQILLARKLNNQGKESGIDTTYLFNLLFYIETAGSDSESEKYYNFVLKNYNKITRFEFEPVKVKEYNFTRFEFDPVNIKKSKVINNEKEIKDQKK
jgi:RHS repeat-associated protein